MTNIEKIKNILEKNNGIIKAEDLNIWRYLYEKCNAV